MKMLFVHDNRFWKYNGNYYGYGHYSYDLLWVRYLKYFDEIDVGGRILDGNADECSKMSISNGTGVTFFDLPDVCSLRGLLKIAEAKRILEEHIRNTDVVVARLPSQLGFLACDVAMKMKKNLVADVVGCAKDAYMNHSFRGRLVAPFMIYYEKKCVKEAPNVLYVSRHFLQKRYPNTHFNVGCPDTNVPLTDDTVLDSRLNKIQNKKNTEEIRIGLIASLKVEYKGHDTAIQALTYLIDKYPKIKMCFLGDGDSNRWRNMAARMGVEKHIEFSGSLPGGSPVLKWIDNIDIFIMPSLQETLGRALVEAMSRGCPAIGGAGTAVPEQLPDDCIHERKNAKQLAEMIDYMLQHKQYMKLCAEENFVRAKKYSEEILNERRDYFWNTVIRNDEKND